ncbi:cobalamin-dependent protein [Streptomyces sp. NPDC005438]|uniref:cobalamin B12-binding domain-containing protein n=1 Tax=Streptomyces sp. NPDC005438 TaxID=3156880 RepID=UPI0033B7706D
MEEGRPADDLTARTVDDLWGSVLGRDEPGAVGAVFASLEAGLDPESLLLDVIATVQRRVGTEWAANRMSVAAEHAATAICDRTIAAMAWHPLVRRPERAGATRVTVACVDGEWHALPARLLSEVLRLRGWAVDFLGAQVPSPHLVEHLHRSGAQVVALSSSLAPRLPTAHAALAACQAVGVPVLVGGAAFGPDGRYARVLGANAWASHARDAAEVLERGVPDKPLGGFLVDRLPHLADQEYTMVGTTRSRLVSEVMADLESRFPAMAAYDARQRQHTAEDLSHILDFLAAGLYVDDARLFVDFLRWTAGVLEARGVPAASLTPALALLSERLRDFPRAAGILRAGRESLVR